MLKLLVGLILGLVLIVTALLTFESFRTGISPFKVGKSFKLSEIEALATRMGVGEVIYFKQKYWSKRISGADPKMYAFNNKGELLDYYGWHTAGVDSVFLKLAMPDTFKLQKIFKLKGNLLQLSNFNNEKIRVEPNKDFYILYYYAMWNERYSKRFYQQLKTKCPKNIQLIAINDDKIKE